MVQVLQLGEQTENTIFVVVVLVVVVVDQHRPQSNSTQAQSKLVFALYVCTRTLLRVHTLTSES